ncbi:DUF222 domain-containing protein [Amycolatopsis nalaikhensis]|uniref:DUF222 domain-containing protein n=1 Tax=Amycolatopsis nalaikhensis TaxID=715472 RepID=A0ABY8XRA0_9PSEU|nr:DUF222 domain-containing protein [Amycolatopsis sp. 2-2]WIV58207.1 DUF222 domain-containing protein [Amycolatopsis sp. 2-2]
MKRARALNSGRNLDGSPVPAVAAATGRAAASLSAPMIDVIVDTLRQIPAEHREDAEQHHLALAEDAGHKQVAALGARIVAHLDPDGPAPDPGVSVPRKRVTGMRSPTRSTWAASAA